MVKEQAVIKAVGTEIPLIALDAPEFWIFLLVMSGLFIFWVIKRK